MRAYIVRRLLLMIPTVLLVTVIVFLGIRLIPGSVIDMMVAEMRTQHATATEMELTREMIEHKLGLDLPIHVQYGRWVGNIIMHGDLGVSLRTGIPITEGLATRLPVSFELGVLAVIIALLIALPVGVYSAMRQDTLGDYATRSFAIACIAIPGFWLGTMVMVFPSIWWRWTPPMELIRLTEDPVGNLVQFIVPAVVLGMSLSGTVMRMTRTMMLEILRQDYIRTAWSKGLTERTVVMRHALKNAFIPVVTVIGLNLPVLIGGAVVIEQIFSLPGIGRLLIEAINMRDYSVLCGVNLFVAGSVLLINLGVDLTYAYLDPRIRYK